MMQNCYEFDNSNYSSPSTTKDENEPELEALEGSSSSKDLSHQPKRSSQPHVSICTFYVLFISYLKCSNWRQIPITNCCQTLDVCLLFHSILNFAM